MMFGIQLLGDPGVRLRVRTRRREPEVNPGQAGFAIRHNLALAAGVPGLSANLGPRDKVIGGLSGRFATDRSLPSALQEAALVILPFSFARP